MHVISSPWFGKVSCPRAGGERVDSRMCDVGLTDQKHKVDIRIRYLQEQILRSVFDTLMKRGSVNHATTSPVCSVQRSPGKAAKKMVTFGLIVCYIGYTSWALTSEYFCSMETL